MLSFVLLINLILFTDDDPALSLSTVIILDMRFKI